MCDRGIEGDSFHLRQVVDLRLLPASGTISYFCRGGRGITAKTNLSPHISIDLNLFICQCFFKV